MNMSEEMGLRGPEADEVVVRVVGQRRPLLGPFSVDLAWHEATAVQVDVNLAQPGQRSIAASSSARGPKGRTWAPCTR